MELKEIVAKKDLFNDSDSITVFHVPTLKALAAKKWCTQYKKNKFNADNALAQFITRRAGIDVAAIIQLYLKQEIEEADDVQELIKLHDYCTILTKLVVPQLDMNVGNYSRAKYEQYCAEKALWFDSRKSFFLKINNEFQNTIKKYKVVSTAQLSCAEKLRKHCLAIEESKTKLNQLQELNSLVQSASTARFNNGQATFTSCTLQTIFYCCSSLTCLVPMTIFILHIYHVL